jgi:hypothetical protein
MKRLIVTWMLLIMCARLGGVKEWAGFYGPLWKWVHTDAVYAGHPACDPKQPKRPPCDMKSCAQIGKDGKANGHKCSSYCAKGCCGCGTACTVDYQGEGQNPDEE